MPEINNADGSVSAYGFACGYVERFETGVRYTSEEVVYEGKPLTGMSLTLWAEGCYHVRQHDYDTGQRVFWDCFDTLAEARKRYNSVKRDMIARQALQDELSAIYADDAV